MPVAHPDCTAPFRWRGESMVATTSVPPFLMSWAAAGRTDAAEAMASVDRTSDARRVRERFSMYILMS
jgi:hypothetical protein